MGGEGGTGSTDIGDFDVVKWDAGGEELREVGGAEVDEEVRGGGMRSEEFVAELRSNVGADFEAAWADAWADADEDIRRVGMEGIDHGRDGDAGDGGGCAAPAGMDYSDAVSCGVAEEDGDAVGCEDHEAEVGGGGEESVGGEEVKGMGGWGLSGGGMVDDGDGGAVDLARDEEG